MRTVVIATAFLCNRHRSRRHRHVGRPSAAPGIEATSKVIGPVI
jgi:hypothetical protein